MEKLLIATPCVWPVLALKTHKTITQMFGPFWDAGINFDHIWEHGDVVERARNKLAARFLAGDWTHLFFLDYDMGIAPHHIMRMLDMDLPIVGVNYPQKRYKWDNIIGKNIGSIMELRANLLVGTVMAFDEPQTDSVRGALKVKNVGTGAMMIQRNVFETIISKGLVEKVEDEHLTGAENAHYWCFFNFPVVNKEHRGEDYAFCDLARDKAGFDIWFDPRANATHDGWHTFGFTEEELKAANSKPL